MDRSIVIFNDVAAAPYTSPAMQLQTAGSADRSRATFQASVDGTGSISATVVVEASNDETHWVSVGTITLSATTSASDGFALDATWARYRGRLTQINGTGARAALFAGV